LKSFSKHQVPPKGDNDDVFSEQHFEQLEPFLLACPEVAQLSG
jgi:hypothetical protein